MDRVRDEKRVHGLFYAACFVITQYLLDTDYKKRSEPKTLLTPNGLTNLGGIKIKIKK